MSTPGNSIDVFFELLKAGLWEKDVHVLPFEPIDFEAIYQLADNQSVVGLVSAGLEHVEDRKIIKPEALPFLKKVFAQEGRNAAMNEFIGSLIPQMHAAGIRPLLVKGQGIAQCYSRPQWRSAGDIDFLLDADGYRRAKAFLIPLSESVDTEGIAALHQAMTISGWTVELHGALRTGLSVRVDRVIDEIQVRTFGDNQVRIWNNGEVEVLLPAPDNDIIFVFTHILKHFYKGGIGLRQLCDWCRLLWTYRESLDAALLEKRLDAMGLMSEWRAFAAYAVAYLGMPVEAMPLYAGDARWHRKASRIQTFVLAVGNFGHNRDQSYYSRYPYLIRKTISLGQRLGDLVRHTQIFPLDSLRFFPSIVFNGLRSAVRGE